MRIVGLDEEWQVGDLVLDHDGDEIYISHIDESGKIWLLMAEDLAELGETIEQWQVKSQAMGDMYWDAKDEYMKDIINSEWKLLGRDSSDKMTKNIHKPSVKQPETLESKAQDSKVDDGCSCGARHTSIPSYHLGYCGMKNKTVINLESNCN